jgi:hypothetical protein
MPSGSDRSSRSLTTPSRARRSVQQPLLQRQPDRPRACKKKPGGSPASPPAPAGGTPTTPSPPGAGGSSSVSDSGGASIAAIAGGTAGGVVGVAAIAIGVFFLFRAAAAPRSPPAIVALRRRANSAEALTPATRLKARGKDGSSAKEPRTSSGPKRTSCTTTQPTCATLTSAATPWSNSTPAARRISRRRRIGSLHRQLGSGPRRQPFTVLPDPGASGQERGLETSGFSCVVAKVNPKEKKGAREALLPGKNDACGHGQTSFGSWQVVTACAVTSAGTSTAARGVTSRIGACLPIAEIQPHLHVVPPG